MTYEELSTVITQVESVLNSRPLTPLSSDPNDLEVLTPGHFLLQEPPSCIAEPLLPETRSLRNRWQMVQLIVQSFWKRWYIEYMGTLQSRYKWNKQTPTLTEGTLVLIKDPNLPPLRWKLGRIVRTFPGKDNIVRVAEVKTASGSFVRPASKLCPLPLLD